jgi:hypothetical protein
MEHIGMDVHKRETQLCIIDSETGEVRPGDSRSLRDDAG